MPHAEQMKAFVQEAFDDFETAATGGCAARIGSRDASGGCLTPHARNAGEACRI
jgi:hypothetical protein